MSKFGLSKIIEHALWFARRGPPASALWQGPVLAELAFLATVISLSVGASTFDAVTDFSASINNDTSLWSYRYKPGTVRDGNYSLLPGYGPAAAPFTTINPGAWTLGGEVPEVGVNQTGSDAPYSTGAVWRKDTMLVHPGNIDLVIVSWLSPSTTSVNIDFRFTDLDPNGGNGIAWFVEKNNSATTLSSGSFPNGGASGPLTLSGIPVSAGDRINFIVDPNNGDYGYDSTMVTAAITQVPTAGIPVIITSPQSLTNNAGTTAAFNVYAGGSEPLGYQWRKDGGNLVDGGNVPGTATASLTLSNVLGGDAGGYSLVVTNVYGSVTSAVATLTVIDPVINAQPTGQASNPGENVALIVAAAGTETLSYQWWKDGVPETGATQTSLTLTNLQVSDAGSYEVVVSNAWGSVTSAVAVLSVATWPGPDSFNPAANAAVNAVAVQADGKILVGGQFTTLGGQSRNYIGRLNVDGALDTNFNPGADYWVYSLAVQADGKILVGGSLTTLGGQTRNHIGRLNADGTLDKSFTPQGISWVYSIALQADGKILVGGGNGNIGRLNDDGTPDAGFNPGVGWVAGGIQPAVNSLAVQADGKILVGGYFGALNGQGRTSIGRLNADGTLDASFNPGASEPTSYPYFPIVYSMVVQADGKILVGGEFLTLGGQSRSNIGRLNADGTLDTNFNPGAETGPHYHAPFVYSLAVQADGQILVGGYFETLGGQSRSGIGRLNADGTVDPNFNPGAGGKVNSLALQADGNIVVGGEFTLLAEHSRDNIGRLKNTGPATQSLTFDGATLTWMRGGTSPEVWRTSFEYSPYGNSWITLDGGSRITGGWQRKGLDLPTSASFRARGFTAGGYENGSAWFVETIIGSLPLLINTEPTALTKDADTTAAFSIHASGTGLLNYQWRKGGGNLSDGGNVSGAATATLTLSNVLGGDAGSYSVVISDAAAHSLTSSVASLTVIDPVITADPASQARTPGDSVTFSVVATGTTPLSYQWRKNGVARSGATQSSLTVANLQGSDAGNYDVVVSNSWGSVTSAAALLSLGVALPDSFNPGANGAVAAIAVQTDGKILLGGWFTTLGGQSGNFMGRVNADGRPDMSFNPQANSAVFSGGSVISLVVQADGKILAGGGFGFTALGGQSRNYLGRLNADGTLDTSFNPAAEGYYPYLNCVAVQADGKILVGGDFTTLGAQSRNNIGRINADGTLDASFNPGAGGEGSFPYVDSLAVQADGKILVGGDFTTLGGQSRDYIGRLNSDGTLDTSFNPGAEGPYPSVISLAVQADGKILVGGGFTTLSGQPRNYLGRLNADGTLDTSFNPGADGYVDSLAVQADGKILVGGYFGKLGGENCSYIGRLNADGTLDTSFNPGANSPVFSLALQADGKILVGGEFSLLGGQSRNSIGRLNNTGPATQSLTFAGSTLTWARGGTSPEVWRTTFEYSPDSGASWTDLGPGLRIPGGWQLTGIALPTNTTFRARGYTVGGENDGSGGFVETFIGAPEINTQPVSLTTNAGTTAAFSVYAGGGGPLSYQWRKDGVNLTDGGNVSGAATPILSLSQMLGADVGGYSLVISNADGSVTSLVATLTVMDPVIKAQPISQTNNAGDSVTLSVVAAGSGPLRHQWRFNGTNVPNATNAVLMLTNVQPAQSGGYSVLVSNAYGATISTEAVLSIVVTAVVAWGDNSWGQTNVPTGLSNVLGIAGGGSHSLALLADGTVVAWGRYSEGQVYFPEGLSNVMAIAAGAIHSLALVADGTVVAWGSDCDDCDDAPINVPADLTDVVAVAAGDNHSLALRADGTVVAWGGDNDGGTNVPAGLMNVVAIAAGGGHSLALRADGTVVAWGNDDNGESDVPEGLTSVVAVAAGDVHSLALRADGTVVAWGDDTYDQITVPTALTNVVGIVAGGSHSLALRADGTVIAWGQYSNNFANVSMMVTVPAGLTNVVGIAAGGNHSLVLLGNGSPFIVSPLADRFAIVGASMYFQASTSGQWQFNGTNLPNATNAVLILTNVQQAQSGDYSLTVSNALGRIASRSVHLTVFPLLTTQPQFAGLPFPGSTVSFSIAVQSISPVTYQWRFNGVDLPEATEALLQLSNLTFAADGRYSVIVRNAHGAVTSAEAFLSVVVVVGWGDNYYGQTDVPAGLTNAIAIAAGWYHSLALRNDGTVVAWGNNDGGQTDVPADLTNVVAIAAGNSHSLALSSDGTVVAWGGNYFGQTDVPAGLTNVVAIAGGFYNSLALRADGMVIEWGVNEATVPAGFTNVVGIAAGGYQSLALRDDGTVVGWGDYAQVPSGLTSVVAVAARYDHSLALRADGTVVAWPNNYDDYGLTTVPAGLTNVVAIARGDYHSLALQADGTVVEWVYRQTGGVPPGLSHVTAIAAGGSHSLALVGNGSPALTVWPVARTVRAADAAQFTALAVGQGPLTFQWQFNGTNLAGATNNILNIPAAQLDQAGDYAVVVSNALGTVRSRPVPLRVEAPPMLDPLPTTAAVVLGQDLTLEIHATGTRPLRYQWRKNGANILGATNANFTIPHAQVSDGGSYTVVAANDVGVVTSDPILVVINVPPAPPGDNFADRLAIAGTNGLVGGTNLFATREPGEPNHAGKQGSNSVWYTWQAPAGGIATLRTRGSTFDTLLAVYTNDLSFNSQPSISNLVAVAADEDRGGFFTSALLFNAVAGTDYQIAIDGFAGAQGNFILEWALEITDETVPVITPGQPQSQTVTNGGTASFVVQASGPGLSYQWLLNGALIPGATTASLTLNDVQAADVGLYSARVTNAFGRTAESLAAALQLALPGTLVSQDKLEDLLAEADGTGIQAAPRLKSASAGAAGFISVAMGTIGSQLIVNTNSTTQAGEPNICGVIGGASLWQGLKAATDGTMVVDTIGSGIDTVLAIYHRTNLINLITNEIACDNNSAPAGRGSLVVFEAANGLDYLVQVDGVNGAQGLIQLNWKLGQPPIIVPSLVTSNFLHQGRGLLMHADVATNGPPWPTFLQWQRNGVAIPGATNATLSLNNVQLADAGNYSVVASNPFGSSLESVAIVTVEVPAARAEAMPAQRIFRLWLSASPFQSFVLQSSTDLVKWNDAQVIPPTLGPAVPVDVPMTNTSLQFFRVIPKR